MRPVPTATPSVRSVRPKSVSRASESVTGELGQGGFHAAEVLVALHHPAERLARGGAVDRWCADEGEGAGPVDRLCDSWTLDEVQLAQAGDRDRDGTGERVRDVRAAQPHDLDLALEVGEVDPVVEAAPLQRVMELAGPVGRDDDGGRLRGGDRPELRHGDRVVGEHLEQEGRELVVAAVELVDEQDGGGAGADRTQEWTLEQEV